MGRIVAIGGGEITAGETKSIDRYVCEAVESQPPAALFVPTASGDAAGYRDAFDAYFGAELGCRTRHLTLHGDSVDDDRMRADVDWADFVYVGGGSVPLLLERWRELGFDRVLREAHRAGTILAGLSAGAICWFAGGLVDGSEDAAFTPIDCLGWLDDFACTPHADPSRRAAFREYLEPRSASGIALEDGCAIELADGAYRIHSATGTETAYGYRHRDGRVRVSELEARDEFAPLETLY